LAEGWDAADLDEAADYLFTPGISVLAPALLAAYEGLVTAMHDPTEGGLATGIMELALAAGAGVEIDLDAISIPDLSRRLCDAFGLDPLGTLASGALLATCTPERAPGLLQRWAEIGWPAAIIGRIVPEADGMWAARSGQRMPFPIYAVDEITKLWGETAPHEALNYSSVRYQRSRSCGIEVCPERIVSTNALSAAIEASISD